MPPTQYVSGLDLGQAADYSALVVLEQTVVPDPDAPRQTMSRYGVRHIHRWPLMTSYPDIIASLHEWFDLPPLRDSTLVVDATGVGRPVVDMVKASSLPVHLVPKTITAGYLPGDGTVPKKDLVGAVSTALQTRRVDFAGELEQRPVLERELGTFRVTVNEQTRNESFAAWRDRDHDDMVLALALALWYGEKHPPCDPPPQMPPYNPFARLPKDTFR